MMYKKPIEPITLIIIGVFFVFTLNCRSISNEQQDLTYILQTAFDKIYLAKFGLEYPHTRHSLDRCIQYNDEHCLATYDQVMQGKKKIASLADSKTLDLTLEIIERTCLSKDENIANFTCYGGIMSLYFYHSPEQDATIRSRIQKYPQKIKNIIFNNTFYWYHNRPDPEAWVDLISTLKIDWEGNSQKKGIPDQFRKQISEVDEEPWVIR